MTGTRAQQRLGNLPAEVSSFVDRRREITAVKQLLSVARLLTLTGVGGVGKTRLALRIARETQRSFPDGVWLVELAALNNAGLLAQTVSTALGLRNQSARPLADMLSKYLEDKKLLLVLDNCEHLLDACAVLASTLLRADAGLRILATSRQVLSVEGEQIVAVPPLSAPDPACLPSTGGLTHYSAIRLFTERAKARDLTFTLTTDNHTTVARICHRLDGIPLAIELAAVRIQALPVDQILTRLDDRFRLLTRESPTAPLRHHSLRAAIGWSYDLCLSQEQLLWARTSIFAGGFDLDALQGVCSGHGIEPDDVFDLITALVDKSILARSGHGFTARYELLDTIREYGRDKLREAGEETRLRRRHRDWYKGLAARMEAEWFGPNQIEIFTHLRLEHANMRAALDFCLTEPDEIRVGMRMAAALWFYWTGCGFLNEGRHWLDRVLTLDTEPSEERVKALRMVGEVAIAQGDVPGGVPLLEECRALARHFGDEAALAHATENLGVAALFDGDLPRSVTLMEEALERWDSVGEQGGRAARSRFVLAVADVFQGNFDRAIMLCEQARTICQAHGEQWFLSYVFYVLALAAWARGEWRQATAHIQDCLLIKQTLNDPLGTVEAFEVLAWTVVASGEHERVAVLLGAAEKIWPSVGLSPRFGAQHWNIPHEESMAQARQSLGDEAFEAAFRRGNELTLDQALEYALGQKPRKAGATPPGPPPRGTHTVLSRRERQVAELVARGLSNKDIAAQLVIAQRTAEGHVQRILTKLGFTSRTQLATWITKQQQGQ